MASGAAPPVGANRLGVVFGRRGTTGRRTTPPAPPETMRPGARGRERREDAVARERLDLLVQELTRYARDEMRVNDPFRIRVDDPR